MREQLNTICFNRIRVSETFIYIYWRAISIKDIRKSFCILSSFYVILIKLSLWSFQYVMLRIATMRKDNANLIFETRIFTTRVTRIPLFMHNGINSDWSDPVSSSLTESMNSHTNVPCGTFPSISMRNRPLCVINAQSQWFDHVRHAFRCKTKSRRFNLSQLFSHGGTWGLINLKNSWR